MDGLSAAASVAGIVSLGIQVAQSLVDFYSAYKNQKSEIAHTIKKLERLQGMLEILRIQLAGRTFLADERDALKTIEDTIQDCEVCIHELQDQCDKLKDKDNSTSGIRASAHASARRLAYPFRKGTCKARER